jgi:hypothetical protein
VHRLKKKHFRALDDLLAMDIDGAAFSSAHRRSGGAWDGRKHLFYWKNSQAESASFPRGLLSRVEEYLEDAGVKYKCVDKRKRVLPDADLTDVHADMLEGISMSGDYSYQLDVTRLALAVQQGILWLATNCVAADAVIDVHRAGRSFKMTIEKLFEKHHRVGTRPWQEGIQTMVRLADERGSIVLAPLGDVVKSGLKQTYKLRTSTGREIRATWKHRFLTEDGWKRLGQLKIGDSIFVDGGRVPRKRRKRRYKATYGMKHHRYAAQHYDNREGRKKAYWSVQKHRIVYEAFLNGLSYDEYVQALKDGGDTRFYSNYINPKTHTVHHKNGDEQDNRLSNLELMDRVEHLAQHGRDEHWRNVTARTVLDQVVAMDKCTRELTYDICVDHPMHNFIANGIVVHNSGKTEIAAAIIKTLPDLNILFVVPKKTLLRQTVARLAERLGTVEQEIGVIGGGRFDPQSVTVAIINSIKPMRITKKTSATAKRKRLALKRYLKTVHCVFLDEGHHARATTWYKLIQSLTAAQFRYLLSGTPFGSGNALMVEAATGPVIARVTNDELIELGVSAKPLVRMIEIDQW